MHSFEAASFSSAPTLPATPAVAPTTPAVPSAPAATLADPPSTWLAPLIENVETVVQIVFWFLVGTLSLLTYLQARRTFFQPLKTEVFKLQLTSLTRISEQLHGKTEYELMEEFDLMRMVEINCWRFLDQYGYHMLDTESTLEDDPFLRSPEPAGYIYGNFHHTWHIDRTRTEKEPGERGSFEGLRGVRMTTKHMEAVKRFESLNADPLLPTKISQSVTELLDLVSQNVANISDALDRTVPTLRTIYPTVEALNSCDLSSMHNAWHEEREQLERGAAAVLDRIREYYQSDLIGFSQSKKK